MIFWEQTKRALAFGLLWLFLFSLPVGYGKNLFDVMHYYVVDTAPIHWITKQIQAGVGATTRTAAETADEVIRKVDGEFTESKKELKNLE